MFIYSVRAATLKFIGLTLCAVLLFTGLVTAAAPAVTAAVAEENSAYRYDGAGSEEGRMVFLRQFGWNVSVSDIPPAEFTVPEEFDRLLLGYNEIQRAQGLDLSRYRKKKVTRYTYTVNNYGDGKDKVYANLIVYRGRVIAGDISSADPLGFVQGFARAGE